MLTAFTDDLAIDWAGVDALCDWYLESGSAGLFSSCLSSEATHLTGDEIVQLVDRVVRRTAGRVPVVAGAMGAASTHDRAELARQLRGVGADVVVLVANEFASVAESDGVCRDRLLEFVGQLPGIPFGLYECPVPYKRLITPNDLATLGRSGHFLWLKETSCDAATIARKVEACRGTPLRIFNANLELIATAIAQGAAGFSGIIANFFPRLIAQLCDMAEANDPGLEGRLALVRAIDSQLVERTYPTAYPAIAKYCAAKQGVRISERTRVHKDAVHRSAKAITDRFLGELAAYA